MPESFLEEQLKRIREMSEQISRLRRTAAEHGKFQMPIDDAKNHAGSEPAPPAQGIRESPRRRQR